MFRGPLLHLGTGLFARQLALEHLGAHGLALGAELLSKGLLLRRRVGAEPSAVAGGEAGTVASGKAGTSTGTDPSAFAGGKALACTGTDTGARAGTESLARTGGEAATLTDQSSALTDEATALTDALRHAHAASTLTGKATHLLPVFNALRLTTGEVVDAGERPGLQATLRESRYCDRGQRHGETKDLDGAHLRLRMSVGDWTAPLHNGRSGTVGVKRRIGVMPGVTAYHGVHGRGRIRTDRRSLGNFGVTSVMRATPPRE